MMITEVEIHVNRAEKNLDFFWKLGFYVLSYLGFIGFLGYDPRKKCYTFSYEWTT